MALATQEPTFLGSPEADPYAGVAVSTRGGSTFNAHAYPTKINEAAIVPFILAHTAPGDVVFDGFAGSGSTGLAATMCTNITPDLNGGRRGFLLYDISSLASFIAGTLLRPVEPTGLASAIDAIQVTLNAELGWAYRATDPEKRDGAIRFTVWSEVLECPSCSEQFRYAEAFVQWDPLAIGPQGQCPLCRCQLSSRLCKRVTDTQFDDTLGEEITGRVRVPYLVYGRTGAKTWRRFATADDVDLVRKLDSATLPGSVPVVRMMNSDSARWGELYRAGYHTGLTHLHQFYTRRNLLAVARAWELSRDLPDGVREWVQLWISSYNASHSTLMTRVVAKRGFGDLVPTSAQSGALYVSSLPVEKNVFAGLQTKRRSILGAAQEMWSLRPKGRVVRASSLHVDVPDDSVDYIFTDPPFGDNIQYSEVNFIAEAWLRERTTDQTEEAIVSSYQHKTVVGYSQLLERAFAESFRILKPGRRMTLVFHSASRQVWDALLDALMRTGFVIERTTRLLKSQASFKQTTTRDFVRGDCVILATKPLASRLPGTEARVLSAEAAWAMVDARLGSLDQASDERVGHRLHSWLLAASVQDGWRLPFGAEHFYRGLVTRYQKRGEHHFLIAQT